MAVLPEFAVRALPENVLSAALDTPVSGQMTSPELHTYELGASGGDVWVEITSCDNAEFNRDYWWSGASFGERLEGPGYVDPDCEGFSLWNADEQAIQVGPRNPAAPVSYSFRVIPAPDPDVFTITSGFDSNASTEPGIGSLEGPLAEDHYKLFVPNEGTVTVAVSECAGYQPRVQVVDVSGRTVKSGWCGDTLSFFSPGGSYTIVVESTVGDTVDYRLQVQLVQ